MMTTMSDEEYAKLINCANCKYGKKKDSILFNDMYTCEHPKATPMRKAVALYGDIRCVLGEKKSE